MDASRTFVDQLRQRLHVCAEELFQSAVGKDVVYDGSLRAQGLQHFLVGDILSGLCLLGLFHNLHFAEEYVSDLLGRGDVELLASLLVDACLQGAHSLVERFGRLGQRLGV